MAKAIATYAIIRQKKKNLTLIGPISDMLFDQMIGSGKEQVKVRLPGSGGASDIASLAGRFIIIMNHERRRFLEKVSYVTSPGFGEGGDWRERMRLKGGGPCAVVTAKGVMRYDPVTREMVLQSVHPGISIQNILESTGWNLRLAPEIKETIPPTHSELKIIRKHDPSGFWTRRSSS